MGQEIEAKFYIKDLIKIKERLHTLGAQMVQPRTHEINLRFDTPNKDLFRERRVLRLRKDKSAHLTYKDGTLFEGGAFSRREIEFTVDDFDSAQQFIEALGYEVIFIYEKYRTMYDLKMHGSSSLVKNETNIHLMLDELPYGDFLEIEGSLELLKPTAQQLGLNWDTAIPASYHELFNRVCASRDLSFRDLTFENFKGIQVIPTDFPVSPADE
jgi:adenylate cyclase class 2